MWTGSNLEITYLRTRDNKHRLDSSKKNPLRNRGKPFNVKDVFFWVPITRWLPRQISEKAPPNQATFLYELSIKRCYDHYTVFIQKIYQLNVFFFHYLSPLFSCYYITHMAKSCKHVSVSISFNTRNASQNLHTRICLLLLDYWYYFGSMWFVNKT